MTGMQMAAMAAAGSSFGTVTLNDQSPSDYVFDPSNASASFTLGNDATVTSSNEIGIANWLSLPANVGLFEARMTIVSGGFSSGPAAGSWWPLSTSRTWNVSQTVVGVNDCVATLEIRLISTGIVQDSATITFNAQVDI